MPDEKQPSQAKARKPEKFIQDGLPETGVPPQGRSTPRKRRRGFYARFFTRLEFSELEDLTAEKLHDEIVMLRVAIRRCFEAASTIETTDFQSWAAALAALGLATTRLANLLRAQKLLNGDGEDSLLAAISTALTEVTKEMNL